jgi:hypothetical protein
VPVPVRLRHLGTAADGDVGYARDLLNEVVRHRLLKRAGAHQHRDGTGESGKVDGGLAGRVRAADHVDVLVLAALGLGERRAVVDTRAGHLRAARCLQLTVGDPHRQNDRLGVDRGAVAEPERPGRTVDFQAGRLDGRQQLGAELDGLPPGAVGELAAGHAVREAQVVLDPRGLAGLAAGGELLHEHGAQPLGRAVDGRAEAGRAAAHHDQVVEVPRRHGRQVHPRRHLGVGRRDQRLAVGGDEHREVAAVRARGVEQPLPLFRVRGVPAVGDLVAGEEVAQVGRWRGPAVPDQLCFLDGLAVLALPGLQQLVDDRVELLFWRVPRLEQVVVEVHDVDRVDRGVRVRVRGEQHPAGERVDVHRPLKELDAGETGHPVVRQQDGDLITAQLHLPQGVQCLLTGLRPDDPVRFAVPPAQVAGNSTRHTGIIIHSDYHRPEFGLAGRSRHAPMVSRCRYCERPARA